MNWYKTIINDRRSKLSPVQKAFLDAVEARDESIGKEWHEKQEAITEAMNIEYQRCKSQLYDSGDIMSHLLVDKGLNDPSQIHPNLKNYNHSLEMDRVGEMGMKRKMSTHTIDDYLTRPVERDGIIEMEAVNPDVTIDDLLDRT